MGWKLPQERHRPKELVQTLVLRIIANQKENKMGIVKTQRFTRFRSSGKPGGRKNFCRIHSIGNDGNIGSLEVI